MTAPVTARDVVAGCAAYLRSIPEVRAVVGAASDTGAPYIFQHETWVVMENTQTNAITVRRTGGWAGPNTHNTLRFPRLTIDITVDPIRDGGNNAIKPGEAQQRMQVVFDTVDRHLHRPAGGAQMWGTVRTIDCIRLAEPQPFALPDGNGLLRMSVQYAVTEG